MSLLFTADTHDGLAGGAITATFRTWKRPQVKEGGRYRVGPVILAVDRLARVRVGNITDADARRAGEVDRSALLARLRRGAPRLDGRSTVWRVDFHRVEPETGPPLRDQDDLDDGELAALAARLDRLDAASSHGPWTRATLRAIAEHPATVSTTLAAGLSRERAPFKLDVRKLKRLGLTESLEVGYRLSRRGAVVLAHLDELDQRGRCEG